MTVSVGITLVGSEDDTYFEMKNVSLDQLVFLQQMSQLSKRDANPYSPALEVKMLESVPEFPKPIEKI